MSLAQKRLALNELMQPFLKKRKLEQELLDKRLQDEFKNELAQEVILKREISDLEKVEHKEEPRHDLELEENFINCLSDKMILFGLLKPIKHLLMPFYQIRVNTV